MMAISPKQKQALILGGLAVGAYLIYRWYMNKQAANNSSTGLGTNLGSAAASTLTSLSAGPSTELNYYGATGTQQTTQPISTSQSSSTSVTGSGSGSGTSSNQTSSPADLSYWTPSSGIVTGATAQQFLQAFQATGQNAGQIVPGGTGQPIPLPPGKSYTS